MKSINSTTKAQRIFIWALVVLFPLIRSSETIEPDSHLKMMSLSGILMAFLLYNFYKGQPVKIITNIVITGALCYIIYSGFGLFSGNFPDALFEWYQAFLVFLTAFIIANYVQTEILVSELPKAFTVLSLILLSAGIKDLVTVINEGQLVIPGNTYSLMSFFGHRNLFAQMLFFTFPFTVYCALFPADKWWRPVSFVSVLLSFLFLIILSNRATWLSLLIGGAVVLATHVFFIRSRKQTLKKEAVSGAGKILAAAIISGLVLAVFFYVKYSDVTSVETHTADIVNFEKGSTKDHLSLWKKSVQLIAEKPVLGNGLASWKTEILKYGNEGLVAENNATFYQTPHNDFLWICSQQGFIGLFMYIFLLAAIAFSIYKNFVKADTPEQFYFVSMLQFLFIGYIIYSFFSFPKERIEDFLIPGILAGCLISSASGEYSPFGKNAGRFFILAVCLILAGGICLGFTRYKSEIHLAKALKAKSEKNNLLIIREIPKAYSSFYMMDPVSTPLKWYSGSALFNLGKYNEALVDLNQARELNPYHIHVLNNLASCYEMLGDHSSAIKFYREAVAIAPNFEDAWLNLCAIYFNLHELDEAYASLRRIDLKTKNPKFSQFLQVVLKARLTEIARKTNDRKMEEFLNSEPADGQWLTDLHSRSMEQRVLPEKIIKNMY